ncbi:MAG: WYL domain-containing protein [Burkholderiales bacterium]|nr:WYL domain-containing protein [Burkholderiales bacterium]
MPTIPGSITPISDTIRSDDGEPRSYRVDRIQGASVTGQSFAPRYLVELTPEGPLPVGQSAPRPPTAGRALRNAGTAPKRRRAAAVWGNGPTYVFRCTVCGKTFQRKSMDGSLNPHKQPGGYPCPGRVGTYVRTKY